MRTGQQLFDEVAKHLRTQGKTCLGTSGCAYRGDSGLKCAIGALIPDEVYNSKMEGHAVFAILPMLPNDLKQEFSAHMGLLHSLQNVHDEYPPVAWENQLQRVANAFQLQYTPPEKS